MQEMEEEKENSETRRSWEEETYWKFFHSVQFFQILPSDFHHHLKLPTKFTAYEMAKLPENVNLKGPNGSILRVNLLNSDSNHVMLTGYGWKEFVKAYSLRRKDILVFKYDRTNKCFEVLFFDQTNSCEREASYFVKESELPQSKSSFEGRAKTKSHDNAICSSDSSAHTDHDSDDELDEEEHRDSNKDKTTSKQQNALTVNDSTQKEVPSNNLRNRKFFIDGFDEDVRDKRKASVEDVSILEQHSSPKVSGSTSKKTRSRSSARDRKRDLGVPSNEQSKKRKISTVVAATCYTSNRRAVTEAEISKAFAMAHRLATDESFIMIMRPSHVYKRFSLVVPRDWKPRSFSRDKRQDVILRIKNKTWVTSFCASNNHGHGGFEGGWKKFALDNFLEEFDVCLFVPGGQEKKCFVLDVSIFRVVPEITLLSPVN